jgi:hypothetical protein
MQLTGAGGLRRLLATLPCATLPIKVILALNKLCALAVIVWTGVIFLCIYCNSRTASRERLWFAFEHFPQPFETRCFVLRSHPSHGPQKVFRLGDS